MYGSDILQQFRATPPNLKWTERKDRQKETEKKIVNAKILEKISFTKMKEM